MCVCASGARGVRGENEPLFRDFASAACAGVTCVTFMDVVVITVILPAIAAVFEASYLVGIFVFGSFVVLVGFVVSAAFTFVIFLADRTDV